MALPETKIDSRPVPPGSDPRTFIRASDFNAVLAYIQELKAPADVLLYVNPATGSDSSDGTLAAPLATLDAALARLPYAWSAKCRIYLAAGAYPTALPTVALHGPVGNGEPLFIIGAMVDSGLGTLVSGAGGTSTVVVGGAGMTVDAYRGHRLRVLTGVRAGLTMPVVANAAGSFTLQQALVGALTAGDTFVVEKPGSVITPSVSQTWSTARRSGRSNNGFIPSPSIGFYGIAWSIVGKQLAFSGQGTDVYFDSCWIDFNATNVGVLTSQFDAVLRSGSLGGSYPEVSNSSTSIGGGLWVYNGLPLNTTGITTGTSTAGSTYGSSTALFTNLLMDDNGLYAQRAMVLLVAPDFRSSTVIVGHTVLRLSGNSTFDGEGVSGFQTGLITLNSQSMLIAGSGIHTMKNSLADGLHLLDGSRAGVGYVNVFGAHFPLSIVGTGNVGYGIRIGDGSSAILAAGTTVTGTAGDILVGATSTTHANLTSATYVTDVNFLARAARS